MKKIIVGLSLIMLLLVCIMGNVHAASAKVTLKTTNEEVNKNDEVVVDVNILDANTTKGVGAFMATLEYDKNSLSVEKIEGQNGWASVPTFNELNGKVVINKGSNVTSSETIMKITFKVKENAKSSVAVTLKDITFSEGIEDIVINSSTVNIKVKNATTNPDTNTENPGNNIINNNTIGNNVTQNNTVGTLNIISDNTIKNDTASGKIPQTGESNSILTMTILGSVLVAVIFFIRIKIINNEINKQNN